MSWRLTYSQNHYCDNNIIKSGRYITGEGSLECLNHCSGTLGSLEYQCTDFSPSTQEDWSSGIGNITTTFSWGPSQLEFGYVLIVNHDFAFTISYCC